MRPLSVHGRGGVAAREPRNLWVQSESILSISRVVSDLGRAESFYRSALGFRRVSGGPVDPEVLAALGVAERRANEVRMRIGEEDIVLVQFESAGRDYPAGSRSDDLWFQHLAIVVSDMDAGYSRLRSRSGWEPISTDGPETLPASSGAVRAFKFRDPDGHPLELLWLPPGRGRPAWHERARAAPSDEPFIGIDHSALAVSSTRRSLAFYRSLGLHIADRSVNGGPAQSRLDGVPAARLRVTGLRPASGAGPGLELLAYRPPGRERETAGATDLSTDWTTLSGVMAGSAGGGASVSGTALAESHAPAPALLKRIAALSDPDGHRFLVVSHGIGSLGRPA
jgi:catechol 2,3-dioxygenase-like lactoylglutathione lyase family enzyme